MTMDDEYVFWIDAYTPATIPMERLAEYLTALAKMLGHGGSVHFNRLEKGSTKVSCTFNAKTRQKSTSASRI